MQKYVYLRSNQLVLDDFSIAVYLPMFSFFLDSAGTRFPKVHYLIAFMMISRKSEYLKDRYSSLGKITSNGISIMVLADRILYFNHR